MKIIIAPDKFKGSLTSFEVCEAIADGIRQVNNDAFIHSFPMADGGDGFAAVLKYYFNTDTINCSTVDPLNKTINASYEWDEKNKTAIIEMAVASGLVLLKDEERNALNTSTYGTGLLLKDAIEKGAKKILLGLGGSATNDAGIGILYALGFKFLDKDNAQLLPVGKSLSSIDKIISPGNLPNVSIEIACDVQNILYGTQGAAYVYAPQKGADKAAVKILDDGLRNFANVIYKQTGKDIANIPGTGAAGGIAAGLMAFFDVTLKKGTDIIIDASGINNELADSDLVITGEGKMDLQTLDGKVVSKIASLANEKNIPVIAFCGVAEGESLLKEKLGIKLIGSLLSDGISREQAMKDAKNILVRKATEVYKAFLNG